MKPKQQKPFRFFLRRESGYDLSLSVRFEVAEGYGLLLLQRKDAKEPPPTLVFEDREVTAKELRGGRFIHVLPGSSRRQSYALSRLAEELLQRVPEEGWTELVALTEYGFRYLVAPDDLPAAAPSHPAAVQVAVAPAARAPGVAVASAATVAARVPAARPLAAPTPPPEEEVDEVPTNVVANAPLLKSHTPGAAPSALQRAMAAIRAGRQAGATITGNTEALGKTPRPAPTAKVSGGMTSQAVRPSPPPAPAFDPAEADGLEHEEAIARVKDLAQRLSDLERKYADSLARERDLIEILTRWQSREIGS